MTLIALANSAPAPHRLRHRLSLAGVRGQRVYSLLDRAARRPNLTFLQIGDARVDLSGDDEMSLHLYQGIYEWPEVELLSGLLRPGATFVDVGANRGLFTFLAASLVGEQGRVFSIEPLPGLSLGISEAAQESGLHHVEVIQSAVGATVASAVLSVPAKAAGRASLRNIAGDGETLDRVEVDVRPLTELVPNDGGDLMLKVDVEGWEAEVVAGALPILRAGRVSSMIIEVTPQYGVDHIVALFEMLRSTHDFFVIEPILQRWRARAGLHAIGTREILELSTQRNVLLIDKGLAATLSAPRCDRSGRCSLRRSGQSL